MLMCRGSASCVMFLFFFFKQKTAYEMRISDWSSDVCSSDLLIRAQPLISETLEREEVKFRQTLDKGLRLLDEATVGMSEGATLPGDVAFRLYDTFGFPHDLTEDALRTQGITVDRAGFDAAMAQQKAAARAAWKGSGEKASDEIW